MRSNRQTKTASTEAKKPTVTYNGLDISAICVEVDQKLGRATVVIHVPDAEGEWQPLVNVRPARPEPYTAVITGPIEVKE